MAKSRGQQKALNEDLVARYLEQLTRISHRADLDLLIAEMKLDQTLTTGEAISIAHRYNKGGKKPASKKAAFEAIPKRFVEIARFHAKNKIAAKARPW